MANRWASVIEFEFGFDQASQASSIERRDHAAIYIVSREAAVETVAVEAWNAKDMACFGRLASAVSSNLLLDTVRESISTASYT